MAELLSSRLSLGVEWIDEKVSTIFLDGKPVDDLDAAIVREGCTLALSSAVPGLVGAAMRRKGFYAPLRNTITHEEEKKSFPKKESLFRVKLFGLAIAELGPVFLKRGIYMNRGEFESFLDDQPESFFSGLRNILLDGRSAPLDTLKKTGCIGRDQWIQVKICESR